MNYEFSVPQSGVAEGDVTAEYDPKVAALDIAKRFYQQSADGRPSFVAYFMLDKIHHTETEKHLLQVLRLGDEDAVRSKDRQLVGVSDGIGLFSTTQFYEDGTPLGVWYEAEPILVPSLGLI